MNLVLWLVDGVLGIAGLVLTCWLVTAVRTDGRAPARLVGPVADEPAVAAAEPAAQPPLNPDVLWQKSLFNPQRSEAESAGAPQTESSVRLADLELLGINIIGDQACAVILVNGHAPPGAPAGGGTPPSHAKARGAKPVPADKRLFRVGEMIADSGFKLKDVRLTEVVVSRGTDEQVLKMDRKDPRSTARAQTAAQDAQQRLAATAAAASPAPAAAKPAAGLQAPPAPPPLPGAAPVVAGAGVALAAKGTPAPISREELIKRALEARKRFLEQQKKTAPKP